MKRNTDSLLLLLFPTIIRQTITRAQNAQLQKWKKHNDQHLITSKRGFTHSCLKNFYFLFLFTTGMPSLIIFSFTTFFNILKWKICFHLGYLLQVLYGTKNHLLPHAQKILEQVSFFPQHDRVPEKLCISWHHFSTRNQS